MEKQDKIEGRFGDYSAIQNMIRLSLGTPGDIDFLSQNDIVRKRDQRGR
jgi:hypothetical protein